MKRITLYLLTLVVLAISVVSCNKRETVVVGQTLDSMPPVYPDLHGSVIPLNVGPLNLSSGNKDVLIDVVVTGKNGEEVTSQGLRYTDFDIVEWKELLAANVGEELTMRISLRDVSKEDSKWTQYAPMTLTVSADSIDHSLVYRLIAPGYETFGAMGIYQTDLSTGEQTAIVKNTILNNNCVNCHSFVKGNPQSMSLHIRGSHGCTMVKQEGRINLYNTKTDTTKSNCVYPYWHPDGRYIAYSLNQTNQVFHVRDARRIEVFDHWSDVAVYDTQTEQLFTSPMLNSKGSFETFPVFSPCGKWLYFCTSEAKPTSPKVQPTYYDLCRIAFNAEDGTFGEHVDTIVKVSNIGKSISFPRPSPCGKYLVYTLSDFGQFSIWHSESDLRMLNIETGQVDSMSVVNSDDVESYHSWSSNGRWLVVSSRRANGLFTQPYIAHIDENGKASKPFLMPLNPVRQWDEMFFSVNIPEFVTSPVELDIMTLERKLNSKEFGQFGFRE